MHNISNFNNPDACQTQMLFIQAGQSAGVWLWDKHWFTSQLLNMKSIRFPFAQELIREVSLAYALIDIKTS